MWNKSTHTIKTAYEEAVKYVYYRKPMENSETYYDLNLHLEVKKPENEETSKLLPIKNENYIKSYVKQILEGAKECNFDYDIGDYTNSSYTNKQNFAYTYHDRLFNYNNKINQIDYIINKLSEDLETRQAVAITLIPEKDFTQIQKNYSTMPCLNEICFNIEKEKNLYMSCFFRSNDLYKALYYNMRGLIKLGEFVKESIEDRIEKELKFKRYNHEIFNGHIYKEDLKQIGMKLGEKL
jgi:thymidylate synthase